MHPIAGSSTSVSMATGQDTMIVVTTAQAPTSNLRMSTPEPNPPYELPWIEQRPAIPVPESPLPTLAELLIANKKMGGIGGARTKGAKG